MEPAVFDAISDAVVGRMGAHGTVTFLNRAAERLYGWTRAEISQSDGRDPLRTEYPVPVDEIETELRVAGAWEGQLVRHTRVGRRVPILSRWVRAVGPGGTPCLVQIDRPLVGADSGQRAGLEREEIFRLLVASVSEYAIFVLDPEGRVLTWNEGAERLKRYRREEILGRHFSIFYEPADVADGRPERILAQAAAEGHFAEEGWRVRKDGTRFWASILLTALWDDSRQLRGFAKITRDLTEKHAQMERLAELESVKSQFLRLASHELGGPLAIIRGYTSMLAEGLWGKSTPAQVKAYEVLDSKARHMVWLVNQLLEASRLEDTAKPSELRPIDLRGPVGEAFDEARTLAPPSHRLVLNMPDRPVIVHGDEHAVVSIVQNLLSNAVKYSPAGGTITCEVTTSPSHAAVSVTDSGIGISDADLARLFTRFGRIITRDNSHIPGAGLGLYLSRDLARRQGGDLQATSVEGSGSTFELTLPIA
jgi:PAS domain S-box-containing protein